MFLKNSWCLTLGWYVIFISNRGVWRRASLVIGSILAVRRAKHDSCRRRCTNLYRTSGVEVNSDASLLFLIVVKRFVIWLCNIGTMIHLWRMWILSKQVTVNRMSNFALGPFCTCLFFLLLIYCPTHWKCQQFCVRCVLLLVLQSLSHATSRSSWKCVVCFFLSPLFVSLCSF